jgi:deoxyribonuclease-4
VAGGLENALHSAVQVGCDCVQIFVKNQRQWRAPPLRNEQIERFRAALSATLVAPVIAHASYLLNLASPDDRARLGSVGALTDELERCEALGVTGLVLHPGAHLGGGGDRGSKIEDRKQSRDRQEADRRLSIAECRLSTERTRESEGTGEANAIAAGIERITRSLDEVHRRCVGFRSMILLETTAGQGTSIGWRCEHLRGILDRVGEPDRLGVCLDTCHLFAAGYDLRTPEAYAAMIDELDRVIGVARVRCIHMNDSKRGLGSRVDRHEHIGKGKIGKNGFANFMNDPRFTGVPMILETPKGVDGRGTDLDKVNLKRLRAMVRVATERR